MFTKVWEAVQHWVGLMIYSWTAIGPRVLARNLVRYWRDHDARSVDSGFDARFGTDTNRELTPGEAQLPQARRGVATMYLPTMDQDLEEMIRGLAWTDAQLRQATFVDIGSGKGRVVMLAAMRRFREVIGLELSPVLHEVATRNLEVMRSSGLLSSPARVTIGDATELDVPRGPLIAYLYHPFRDPIAAQVMTRLIASLEASPRPAAILYGHPTLQRCIDPRVFAHGGVFREVTAGGRTTRRFRIGWTIWTNQAWLDERSAAPLHALVVNSA